MEPLEKAALQYSIRLLSRKDYTVKNLRDKLEKRYPQFPAAQKVIDKLIELNYLDDVRFARSFARSRLIQRLWGPRKVIFELVKRGIDKVSVQQAVDSVLHDYPREGLLDKAFQKWVRTHGNVIQMKDLQKLNRYLLQKGFDPETIGKKLSKIKAKKEDWNI